MTGQLDLSKSEQYTLSIRLSTDGFSFSIYTPLERNALYYKSFSINPQHSMAANVKHFISQIKEFDYPYKRINILISSVQYTTVPMDYFREEDMDFVFHQNVHKASNDIILSNILSRSNIAVIFAMDKLSHVYLSEKFPTARFFSNISPLIEDLSARSKQGNSRKLFANLTPSRTDLFGFEKGSPIMINSFNTTCSKDVCYYILNLWQKSGYDQNRDELHIYGHTSIRKEVTSCLQDFIKRIFIINPKAEFISSLSDDEEMLPFEIQSIITCE